MTANPQSPPPSDELDKILKQVFRYGEIAQETWTVPRNNRQRTNARVFHINKAKVALNAYILAEGLKLVNSATIRREAAYNPHSQQMEYVDVMDKNMFAQALTARFGGKS